MEGFLSSNGNQPGFFMEWYNQLTYQPPTNLHLKLLSWLIGRSISRSIVNQAIFTWSNLPQVNHPIGDANFTLLNIEKSPMAWSLQYHQVSRSPTEDLPAKMGEVELETMGKHREMTLENWKKKMENWRTHFFARTVPNMSWNHKENGELSKKWGD